ncbi:hypothetical protein RNJ44_02941 [Nakaseomyces bracarensis]|uniref:Uncharacterized protein n=1 Tax=Nakaseomyces bracarensis TaxID=273131 RepID=A0ABR4P0N5_9SACH
MRIVRFRGYGGQIQRSSKPKRIDLKHAEKQNRTFVIQNFNYTTSKRRPGEDEDQYIDSDDFYEYDESDRGENEPNLDLEQAVGESQHDQERSTIHVSRLRMKQVCFNDGDSKGSNGATVLINFDKKGIEAKKPKKKAEEEIHRQMLLLQASNTFDTKKKPRNEGIVNGQRVIHPITSIHGSKFAVQRFNQKQATKNLKKTANNVTAPMKSSYSFRVNLNRS